MSFRYLFAIKLVDPGSGARQMVIYASQSIGRRIEGENKAKTTMSQRILKNRLEIILTLPVDLYASVDSSSMKEKRGCRNTYRMICLLGLGFGSQRLAVFGFPGPGKES